jgi:TP901 family phage tail tape measure protein
MSLKTVSIGVVIGAVWQGAAAVANSSIALSRLSSSIDALKAKKATLKADTKEYEQAEKKIAILGSAIDKLNQRKIKIDAIVANQEKFKSQITEKLALGASVVAPLKVAIDFESSMADVKKVVNFANELDFRQFESSILSLSRTIPLSAQELASIAASGGQLGIAKEKLIDFTQVVAKMSTAFDMRAEAAGESIAKLMNVYKLDIKEVTSLGDAINHLSDNSAAKAKDMVETMGRIGGTAKIFGLSGVQAAALSNAFIALGRAPEVAATGINAMLTKLATADKQGKKFQKALQEIGLDAKALKSSIQKDANGALVDFLKRLSKVKKSEQMGVLSDLFGMEYSDDIALLIGSLNVYEDALKNTANASVYANSMQKEFQNRSATTANNIQLLKNGISEIAINLGSVLLPAVNSIISPIRSFSNAIASLIQANPVFGAIFKGVMGVVIGVVALSVMLSTASFVGSYFVLGLLRLKNALTVVSVGIRLLGMAMATNPIGAAIAGIALAATLIYSYWEPIKGFFGSLWAGIKAIFGSAFEYIKQIFSFSPLGLILQVWEPVFAWFGSKFEWLSSAISSVMSVGSKIAGFLGFGEQKQQEGGGAVSKVGAVAFATTTAIANPVATPTVKPAVATPKIPSMSQVRQTKTETNIAVNINNPKVTTPAEKEALRADIQKAVDEALRRREQASINKTMRDVT